MPATLRRLNILLVAACVFAGCVAGSTGGAPTAAPSATGGPYVLEVANVDGPDVDVLINDRQVLSVLCADTATLSPGVDGVPPLPWSIVVRTSDLHVLFGPKDENGQDGTLLIRRGGVLIGAGSARGPAPSPIDDPCAWLPGPRKDTHYAWGLGLSNATTLTVTLAVNGAAVRTFPPTSGTLQDELRPADLPPLPWHVEVRSPSGRVLVQMDVLVPPVRITGLPRGGGSVSGTAARVDLSCGRIDVWAGPPLSGPMPGPGTPGDCAP